MLTAQQLCTRLGIAKKRLDRWLRQGLPCTKKGKQRKFDPAAVAEWIKEKGKSKAEQAKPQADVIATTREEAARALNVSVRTFADWMKETGFPGKPGSPGRQDGYFPLAEISEWRKARFGGDGRSGESGGKLAELRERKLQLEIDQLQIEFEKACGTILDAEDMAGFLERHVGVAKTVLEQLADKIDTRLPAKLEPKTRAIIRAAVEETVTEAFNAVAETMRENAAADDEEKTKK